MRLKDVVIKPQGPLFLFYHLRSSFQAELDQPALDFLSAGLRDDGKCTDPAQQEMFQALEGEGLLEPGPFEELDIRPDTSLVKVEAEVTNSCQIRCRHCFVDHSKEFLPFTLFEKFAREARQLGAVTVSLNGGEATLHPEIHKMLSLLSELRMRPRLFTNGCSIDNELARKFAVAGLSRAIISLETFEEFHDWLRGKGTWESTLRGVKAFLAAGVEVLVNPVITQKNLHLIDSFTDFVIDELGATAIEFGVVAPLGAALDHWDDLALSPEDFPQVFKHGTAERNLPGDCEPLSCKAAVNQLYMDVSGKIYPCHFFAFPEFELGNLENEPLTTIYGEKNEANQLLREFPHSRLSDCHVCSAKGSCGGGCRGRAFQISGLYSPDTISCTRFLKKKIYLPLDKFPGPK